MMLRVTEVISYICNTVGVEAILLRLGSKQDRGEIKKRIGNIYGALM